LVLILAATLGVCGLLRHAKAVSPSAAHVDAAVRGPPVLWDVPTFAFEDAHGQFIRDSSLHGHVWVADFIFTRCTSVCPMITAEMTLLRRTIRSPGVRFVSFSIDPEFDTREVLEAYGTRWDADPRWLLLRPDPSRVVDFAKGMHVPFERSPDPDEPLLHTSVFFLVDGDGRVRGLYGSLDEPSVARLVADMNVLDSVAESAPGSDNAASSRKPAGATSASRGFDLFLSVGCRACHSDPRIAPGLAGLVGAAVTLGRGERIVADDAYVRESILDPERNVVAGYNPLMPPYRGHLTDAEVDDLVAYVHSLDASAAGPSLEATGAPGKAAEAEVRDPVCGMRFKPSDGSPRTDFRGRMYYFCGDRCRDRFEHDPGHFVP
jgi:cytochrome oxidase Cu insertion factor (SCO1/SenC/PrrC family)/YHS domain-containing protein